MPLYFSNFKSFSNKISRIFRFEQLFCMAFTNYLYWKANIGLGLSWGGRCRVDMGGFQLSDATGSSHSLSSEFLGCPSKSCPPYCACKAKELIRWAWYYEFKKVFPSNSWVFLCLKEKPAQSNRPLFHEGWFAWFKTRKLFQIYVATHGNVTVESKETRA